MRLRWGKTRDVLSASRGRAGGGQCRVPKGERRDARSPGFSFGSRGSTVSGTVALTYPDRMRTTVVGKSSVRLRGPGGQKWWLAAPSLRRGAGPARSRCAPVHWRGGRMGKPGRARAFEPDHPGLAPAIQFSAALVLSDKGRQGGERLRHGPGRLTRAQQIGKSPKGRPQEGSWGPCCPSIRSQSTGFRGADLSMANHSASSSCEPPPW
jgi:hypothetical protein